VKPEIRRRRAAWLFISTTRPEGARQQELAVETWRRPRGEAGDLGSVSKTSVMSRRVNLPAGARRRRCARHARPRRRGGGAAGAVWAENAGAEEVVRHRKPAVYCAGPWVFLPRPEEISSQLSRLCDAAGLVAVLPFEDAPDRLPADAAVIYRENITRITKADAVVADISPFRGPHMDPGTAMGIGYAAALGKPVLPTPVRLVR
jgi:hypothetical protein